MTRNILLYGATGFSGGLIAARAATEIARLPDRGDWQFILAGREGSELRRIGEQYGMAFRVFALDDAAPVARGLDGIDVVINAAGPFARTAPRLTRAALVAGCHYVDINGELAVYQSQDDFASKAYHAELAIVSGAAASSGVSDVMLDLALRELRAGGRLDDGAELGSVRIAMAQTPEFSRGSAATALELLRDEVMVVRKGMAGDGDGGLRKQMVSWHEPVGRLERSFAFPARDDRVASHQGPRIASAANLIDTPTARRTIERHSLSAQEIVSYVETGRLGRIFYQASAMLSPLLAVPGVRSLIRAQTNLLPAGPSRNDMRHRHAVILEIDDIYRAPLVHWTMMTPNVYLLTAQIAVAVAIQLARDGCAKRGWVTPADLLALDEKAFAASRAFETCDLRKEV